MLQEDLQLNPSDYQICLDNQFWLSPVNPTCAQTAYDMFICDYTYISSKVMLRVLLMSTTAAGTDGPMQQHTGQKAVPLFMSGTTMLQAPLPFFTSGNK